MQAASTPNYNDVFQAATDRVAAELRVCLPAKVVKVLGQQRVDLQPLLKQKVRNFVFDYPIVASALVCMPVGADYEVTYRLQPGDTGMLICADRSLDSYAASDGGKPVDPADPRCHQLTDAIFVPGLVPHAKQTATTDDMVLRNGAAVMRLQKGGTFSLGNGTQELVALVTDLAARVQALGVALAQAKSTGPGGPLDPATIQAAGKAGTGAGQIQAALSSLQGT